LAQGGYFSNWFERVDKTQAEQPHWITPLATTTPRLEEEVRYDQLWQENAEGITTNNYDGGKGLELIPLEKVEVIFNVPPYIAHNSPGHARCWAVDVERVGARVHTNRNMSRKSHKRQCCTEVVRDSPARGMYNSSDG
jgi:hypothetical protein